MPLLAPGSSILIEANLSLRASVLLVEDFAPYRAYITSLLKSCPQLKVVDEASEGLQAVEKARHWKPDIILMDIGLPLLNGIEAARRIREVSPHSRIVFLSQDTSPELVEAAVELGVSGYVFKSEAETNLFAAIDAVLDGKQFFTGQTNLSSPENPY